MMAEFIRTERVDQVAVVTIDRPPVNALNSQVLAELRETFKALDADDEVRAVVLTGAGDRAFVAGADIREMAEMSPMEARVFAQTGQATFRLIENHRLPIIAAVNGYALGGGCELMLACDLRIASDRAVLGQPEVTRGIPPGFGATQRLARLVGIGRAKQIVLLGEHFSADEAYRMGLVNRVVPHDSLLTEALNWAHKIAAHAPLAIRLAKAALNRSLDADLASGCEYEREVFGLAFSTRDQREGMTAFLEKRTPEYRGR